VGRVSESAGAPGLASCRVVVALLAGIALAYVVSALAVYELLVAIF
jgi:hypothetical protein